MICSNKTNLFRTNKNKCIRCFLVPLAAGTAKGAFRVEYATVSLSFRKKEYLCTQLNP